MVGTTLPVRGVPAEGGQAQCVEIDLDACDDRHPLPVGGACSIGDAKETLQALIPHLIRKDDRGWREEIEQGVAAWWKIVEKRALEDARPDEPAARRARAVEVLPDDAIITADSGSSTNWYARQVKLKQGNLASLSGTLATMVPGVPYAIAAKFAHPDRPVICFVGDGAFQMLGMNEMLTVKRYMDRWSDKRLIFCVFNNQDLNQVTWEQRVMEGDPKYPGTQWLPDLDYAPYGRAVRPRGDHAATTATTCAARGSGAFAADRPVVLEVKTDPEVPPLPPHITFEQAKKMAKAMRNGIRERTGVMEKSMRGKLVEFLKG